MHFLCYHAHTKCAGTLNEVSAGDAVMVNTEGEFIFWNSRDAAVIFDVAVCSFGAIPVLTECAGTLNEVSASDAVMV